jgi:gas vesicle protein
MQKLRVVPSGFVCVLVVAGLVLAMSPSGAEARTKYRTTFKEEYKKVAESNKVTCDVCHVPKKKKTDRNNYGKALLKTLKEAVGDIPDKGVADVKKIKESLKKAEKEKSAIDGKTFGDLLKEGKLPATEK